MYPQFVAGLASFRKSKDNAIAGIVFPSTTRVCCTVSGNIDKAQAVDTIARLAKSVALAVRSASAANKVLAYRCCVVRTVPGLSALDTGACVTTEGQIREVLKARGIARCVFSTRKAVTAICHGVAGSTACTVGGIQALDAHPTGGLIHTNGQSRVLARHNGVASIGRRWRDTGVVRNITKWDVRLLVANNGGITERSILLWRGTRASEGKRESEI